MRVDVGAVGNQDGSISSASLSSSSSGEHNHFVPG